MRAGRALAIPRDAPPTAAVGALARRVTKRAREAHVARAICGGIASAALVLALVVFDGGTIEDPDALVLAAFAGALAFFGWRASEHLETDAIVRRVDDVLELGGEFVAAYESDRERKASRVAQLGAARLAGSLRRTDAMEAAIPHTLGFVALPLVGLAAIILAIGARDAGDREAAGASARSLFLAGEVAALVDDEPEELTEELRDEIERVARAAVAAGGMPGGGRGEEMASVARDLDRLACDVPAGSELARALARAAAAAESIAMEAGADAADADTTGEPGSADGDASGGAGAGSESDGGSGGGDGSVGGSSALESGGAGSASAGAVAAAADSVPADRDPARGRVEPSGTRASRTGAELRWWSERDAGLVKRWRERAASARDGSRK